MNLFIGFAKDIHNLQKNNVKKLVLGGYIIDDNKYSIVAHSDGDVVLHAISSAILGAMNECITLGELFSDEDEKNKNIDSKIIINKVINMMNQKGLVINNVDITIVCEHIYLKQHLSNIKKTLSTLLSTNNIGIKCTRFEDQNNNQIECDVIVSLINS